MALITNTGQGKGLGDSDLDRNNDPNYIPQSDRLREFSISINKQIVDFAKGNNLSLTVGTMGFVEYPHYYPNQEYIQLFSVNPIIVKH